MPLADIRGRRCDGLAHTGSARSEHVPSSGPRARIEGLTAEELGYGYCLSVPLFCWRTYVSLSFRESIDLHAKLLQPRLG